MATPQGTSRRYDLDWLRVLGVCVVFFYHLARVFDPFWWHIKNARLYPFAGLARLLVGEWMMPLLFLVSGAAVFYALRTRDARAFVTDRAARLLVPFGVGVFTHIALQVYLERLSFGQFAGSFPAFYPHYFDGIYGFGGNFAWMGLHLWFLPALFFYSVLFLPLFLWMKRGAGARVLNRLAAWLARPGAVYLLAVPVMALLVALDPATLPGNRDAGGWSLLIYPLFFLYGFILVSHPALEESIRRLRRVSLAAALLLSLGVTLAWLRNGEPGTSEPGFAFFAALYGLNAWCWLLVIWGFGTRRLNFTTPLLRYANDAILPFYVLHQTVMVAVAFFVVRWPIPDALKFIVIAAFSLAIILALYQLLIRPFNPMRVLFGLRPRNH
jgi:peptidoglycan/LPS O-acetylase OafA/YrhL